MAAVQSSPQKSSRGKASQYSSHLIFDTKGQAQLVSLTLASCNITGQDEQQSTFSINTVEDGDHGFEKNNGVKPMQLAVPDTMTCNCCQVTFTDREEQLSHYKCDWHRYNLHLKLRGQQGISEDEFENVAAMSDVSSISGSDDSDNDDGFEDEKRSLKLHQLMREQPAAELGETSNIQSERKFPKVFYKNQSGELVSVYRCLLHHKKHPLTSADEIVRAGLNLTNKTKWVVLMVSAGHFAGAVFQGKEVVEHKTFHRYTVRAKRGTAQSSRDNQGKAPKSAGARLRRYNEAALSQDVSELLANWSGHFTSCDLIFVRIPVNNRGMFYGGKNPPLKKDDARIRVIPFPTRRPTFNEVRRVHQVLASVECYGPESEMVNIIPYSPPRMFVPETGELQLREQRPEKKVKQKLQNQDRRTSPKPEDDSKKDERNETNQDSDLVSQEHVEREEDPVDMDLVEMMQTVDFSHLKEFESTPKKKHKKKKKESPEKKTTAPGTETMDEDRIRWQNKLFTACKTGDLTALQSVISDIRTSCVSQHPSISDVVGGASAVTVVHKVNRIVEDKVEGPIGSTNSTDLSQDMINVNLTDNQSGSQAKQSSSDLTTQSSNQLIEPSSSSGAAENYNKQNSPEVANSQKNVDKSSEMQEDSNSNLVSELLNKQIGDSGLTFLHLSSKSGHPDIVTALLEAGADPTIKDKSGKVPYNVGEAEVRNSYRRFMANYPDRYDYTKAQVPSPLTAEMEAERKQKNAEKRKQKKKAFNERNKEKKALEAKAREENQEKERFLKLSDREKRALAAERRLVQQTTNEGGVQPVLSRCWQCGADITGKIPFEYADYKFCTTKCLREHRAKPTS